MSSEKSPSFSYAQAGVDIANADAAKAKMADSLKTNNPKVLNTVGAFASLFDGRFPAYKEPVLVMKMEEPGTKQKLAFQHGYVPSLCYDLVNHLVNDIAVMGAEPQAVQDVIVCGKLESEVVTSIVKHMAEACRAQDCELVGGETSEQPGVIPPGTYILAASVVGVVEKTAVIDGSDIKPGDLVFAVASNGLHTNGYSLARKLLDSIPGLADQEVEGERFLDAIMKPHTPYLHCIRSIKEISGLKGLAHITGGGIEGNLNRILPKHVDAKIQAASIKVLPIFKHIQKIGNVAEADMRKTFNMGVGLCGVASKESMPTIIELCKKQGLDAYEIGEIIEGTKAVFYD